MFLELEPAGERFPCFFVLAFRDDTIHSAGNSVAAGNGRHRGGIVPTGECRWRQHGREKSHRDDQNPPHLLSFNSSSSDSSLLSGASGYARGDLVPLGSTGAGGWLPFRRTRDWVDLAGSILHAWSIVETLPATALLACHTPSTQLPYESMSRSIPRALPVFSSQSITTAHRRTSPVAGSKRTGILFRNLPTTSSFFTPITPS